MKRINILVALLTMAMTTGCMPAIRSYVDPSSHKAGYGDLRMTDTHTPVRVEVQFLRDGEPHPELNPRLLRNVENVLRLSGAFDPDPLAAAQLLVVVNNVGDIDKARMAGVKVGLTWGLSGDVVDDDYLFNITYTSVGGDSQSYLFRQTVHQALGGAKGPAGLKPTTPSRAYEQVIEDAILNFVQSYERKNFYGG